VTDRSAFFDRLAARAASASEILSSHESEQLARYVELLRHWNRRINLTALPLQPLSDATVDRLLIEPITRRAGARAVQWITSTHDRVRGISLRTRVPIARL